MAYTNGKSGVITGDTSQKYYPKIYWSQQYDIATNKSIVTIDKITIVKTTSVSATFYLGDLNALANKTDNGLYINNIHKQPMSIQTGNWHIVASGNGEFTVQTKGTGSNKYTDYTESFEITHDIDGRGEFTVKLLIDYIYASSSLYFKDVNISATTVELAAIPRASFIESAANIILGNSCDIKWTPANAAFKYKLSFSLSDWRYDVKDYITPNSTNTYTYTGTVDSKIAIDEIQKIYFELPNVTSESMTVTLTTYGTDNEQIGNSSSKTFIVTIPPSVAPTLGTVTVTPTKINEKSILVQSKNKVQISVAGCSAGSGSSIKSYTFDCIQNESVVASISTENTFVEFGPFAQHGTIKFKVTVIDERQRSSSNVDKEPRLECYEYSMPTISSFNAYRSDEDGKANTNGMYLMCNCTAEWASVNKTNDYAIKLTYATGETSKDVELIDDNLPINVENNTKTYKVYATITDLYGGSASSSIVTVFGSSRILNITADGTGIAIGKMAEESELFECMWPAKFHGEVSCKSLVVDGKSISGSAGGISDIDLINLIYPIGSVYISVNSGDVCDISLGTWVRLNVPDINGVYMWTRTE